MSTPWERCAPDPNLPRIAACSFCAYRWLAYQSGEDARGRPVYMCLECRAARGLSVISSQPSAPERKPPARETEQLIERLRRERGTRKVGGAG